jgi:hypothetical protein
VDVALNSNNLKTGSFGWSTQFHFNYNTDKITSYKVKAINNGSIVSNNYLQPIVGHSYYSLFSYKWRGLDNQGNPQAELNGAISNDYSAITNSTNTENIEYSGTITPKYYGNLMNSFSWKGLQLSVNMVYKLGYVFRRSSLANSTVYSPSLFSAAKYQQPDYENRWQKPGDELFTSVPSLIYPVNGAREAVYSASSAMIEKGDHIRLQDLNLGYSLGQGSPKRIFSNLSLYVYASNLGILWKATNRKLDPDYNESVPLPKTISLGVKATF